MYEIKQRSVSLLKALGCAFLIFTFCRIIFLIFNFQTFSSYKVIELVSAFAIGVWFDSVPIFYYNIIFILFLILPHPWYENNRFRQITILIFLICNGIAIFQNLTDVGYFPFNKKRTGAEIFHLAKEFNSGQIISYVTDFWYLFLIFILAMVIIFQFLKKELFPSKNGVGFPLVKKNYIYWFLFILISLGVTIIGTRGGIGLIPLRTFDASRYVTTALVPLAINTPLHLISTIEAESTPEFKFFNIKTAESVINPDVIYNDGPFIKKNVIIIIVESLSKEYMGFYNNSTSYTPFLDSLCRKSLTFKYSFANGTISMDAPPAIISGIANLLNQSYIISKHNINTPSSPATLLAIHGYNSSFYHAGENGTMGFDNFMATTGIKEYKGLDEYPAKSDFDGRWGIFDEPYLQYYAEELNKKKQPFFSSVFTLSSHHPYTIPEKYKKVLQEGTLPIHRSMRYADLSLKNFFEKAKGMPWFKNTLFVITGDHTSDSDLKEFQTPAGRYSIPFIFYSPEDPHLTGENLNVMQQSNLLPTIMDYLNYPSVFRTLGKSAFKKDSYAVFYTGGSYSLIQNNMILIMTASGQSYLYDYIKDPYLQKIINSPQKKEVMDRLLKSYLQLYTHYLQNNLF